MGLPIDFAGNFPLFLFLISIASSFGAPVGETIFVISAGSQSSSHIHYLFYVTIIFIGAIFGDCATYALASRFRSGFSNRFFKKGWYAKTNEFGTAFFNKYGTLSVFLSRFVFLTLSAPLNYLSGFERYPLRKFVIAAATGELIYAMIYTYIGFVFRGSGLSIYAMLIDFSIIMLLVMAISYYSQIWLKKFIFAKS